MTSKEARSIWNVFHCQRRTCQAFRPAHCPYTQDKKTSRRKRTTLVLVEVDDILMRGPQELYKVLRPELLELCARSVHLLHCNKNWNELNGSNRTCFQQSNNSIKYFGYSACPFYPLLQTWNHRLIDFEEI